MEEGMSGPLLGFHCHETNLGTRKAGWLGWRELEWTRRNSGTWAQGRKKDQENNLRKEKKK
jgi:hypothetical protein